MNLAAKRLEEIAKSLADEIGSLRPDLQFKAVDAPIWLSRELPYQPNRDTYHKTWAVMITGENQFSRLIGIRADAIGSKFRGLIAIAAIFSEGGVRSKLASKEPFQVNYAESCESAERRFRPWLEESLVNALNMWRKSL